MLGIVGRSLRLGVRTERQPFDAEPGRPFPRMDFDRCRLCPACAEACPTGAISVSGAGPQTLRLTLAACIACGECVPACPEHAVSMDGEPVLAVHHRNQLACTAAFDQAGGRAVVREARESSPSLEQSGAMLRERIRGRFARSLHVRQVDAGSCNGCELEIAATTNPRWDLERFGIHFVASPRHADLLLVTGPVTRNMEPALRATYEATPEPRLVVAVGACGLSGGIFGEGTYASVGGVDRVLPVDVYVPGCPPTPPAILNGLLVAMDVRPARGPGHPSLHGAAGDGRR